MKEWCAGELEHLDSCVRVQAGNELAVSRHRGGVHSVSSRAFFPAEDFAQGLALGCVGVALS